MGKLNMVRVDYCMIHGQITAKWIKFCPVDRLILADDSLVNDPSVGDTYCTAVPNRKVDIIRLGDVQTAIDRKNDTVLLIFEDVTSVYMVCKNGLQLLESSVGAVQNNTQRKVIIQGAAFTTEKYEKLNEMKAEGVNMFLQSIPENDPISPGSIKKKLKQRKGV